MPKSDLVTPVEERKFTGKDPYTLFDISPKIKEVIREIAEAQQDKDTKLVSELTDNLLDLLDLHEDKYEGYVHVIQNSLAAAKNNKVIADQFNAIATAHNNLAKRLKARIQQDMELHQTDKVNAGLYIVRIQKNSVATLTVEVDPEDLPKRFQSVIPNTDELRFALTNGDEVEGVSLLKGEHIRIVPKK